MEAIPLAVCNACRIRPREFLATDLVYEGDCGEAYTRAQSAKRVGEILSLAHNPDFRWVYLPRISEMKVLLFKCFDSATDGRTRQTTYAAFEDPDSTGDASPRQNIELRALALFD